jgi:hypothetical protein
MKKRHVTKKRIRRPKIYISAVEGVYRFENYKKFRYPVYAGTKRAKILQVLKNNKFISGSFLAELFYRGNMVLLSKEIGDLNLLFIVYLGLAEKPNPSPLIFSYPGRGYTLNRSDYDFEFPDD